MSTRFSRQRTAIKAYLSDNRSHPTADDVYAAVRAEFPNISLGTVYRNLNRLCEDRELRKLSFRDSPDRFDPHTDAHSHFICTCCGRVEDLPEEAFRDLNEAAGRLADGSISTHELTFYGICNNCKHITSKGE